MNVVIFTGAGMSAESGLGTFRDAGGLWEKYKIEDVATPQAWFTNPKLVLEFYNERRKQNNLALPNDAHLALKELERYHHVSIITQNIDDLHERAGSENVLHLHGEITKGKTSVDSIDFFKIEGDINIGDKDAKGKQIRPHVVWFGEPVPEMERAEQIAENADLFIVIGTSLNVYPAAGLLDHISSECNLMLIDPNEVHITRPCRIIKETAVVGVPKLIKELMT